jgi:hypothetical protein
MSDSPDKRLIDLPMVPDEIPGPTDDVYPINLLLTHEPYHEDLVSFTDLVNMAKRRRMSIIGFISSLLCAERDRQNEHVAIHGEPRASQTHFRVEDLAGMPATKTEDLDLSHLKED